MTVLRVPYHLDEYLPGLDIPVRADRDITVGLPAGWYPGHDAAAHLGGTSARP